MNYKMILACDKDGVIGIGGGLPWRCKEDMQHFKKTTLDSVVLMGRKTFESLNYRPLPKRKNIVVTRTILEEKSTNPYFINDIEQDIETTANGLPVWVIGGAEMYEHFFPKCNEIYISCFNFSSTQYAEKDSKIVSLKIKDSNPFFIEDGFDGLKLTDVVKVNIESGQIPNVDSFIIKRFTRS